MNDATSIGPSAARNRDRFAGADQHKLFVLDTNVLLHDAGCIDSFEEHDVAVPITVLEELDHFKKGNQDINKQARTFLRRLDELTGDLLSKEGAAIGPGLGRIRVVLGRQMLPEVAESFYEDTPDHRILNCACRLLAEETGHAVVMVTKDVNLRMKAKSLGIPAQDYTTDKVDSIERIYPGNRLVEGLPADVIADLYGESAFVEPERVPLSPPAVANETFILRNHDSSALARFDQTANIFRRVEKRDAYGITPRNAEQAFALQNLMDPKVALCSLAGKAGTGKTLLALAAALECRQQYRQILLARPVVPLSNRDLGYLPGDIHSKIDPYMQPLFDNLAVIRHQFNDKDPQATRITNMLEAEKLIITPLAYIRGRSLQKVYFIVDEAQNLTPHEVKTIITRAGEGTKIVFTGDIHQIDTPYLDPLSNGLSYLIARMKGQPLYAHVTLMRGERSALAELASDLL